MITIETLGTKVVVTEVKRKWYQRPLFFGDLTYKEYGHNYIKTFTAHSSRAVIEKAEKFVLDERKRHRNAKS